MTSNNRRTTEESVPRDVPGRGPATAVQDQDQAFREDEVLRVREAIANGTYDAEQLLELAVESLSEEFRELCEEGLDE